MDENSFDHFTLPAIFSVLMNSAMKHDREAVKQASCLLDMTPTFLLRGVAYLNSLLQDADDDLPKQHQLARSTLNELTGLLAVLLELDCNAGSIRLMEAELKRGGV